MSLIRWFVSEMIPIKNLDYIQTYLQLQKQIAHNEQHHHILCINFRDHQKSDASRIISKLIWFQIFQLFRYLLLFFLPLNAEQRILAFDIFYICGINNVMNLLGVFLTCLGIYLIYKLYLDVPDNVVRLMDMILFKTHGDRYFLHKQHKQQNICHFIRHKMTESIQQNQLFVLALNMFTLYSIYVFINEMTIFFQRITHDEDENILWLTIRYSIMVDRLTRYESDLFSSYLIANFPMNLLVIVTTYLIDNNNQLHAWKFFATAVIGQQLIGFFVIHLICSIYTIKIHKCSHKLIYWSIHFPLRPLSLHVRSSLYIEKIHTSKQYGIVLGGAVVISMIFFLKTVTQMANNDKKVISSTNFGQKSDANRIINHIIWFQTFQLFRYLLLFFLPLNNEHRILVFDIFYIYGLPNAMNLMGIFLTCLGIYLIYKLYLDIPDNVVRLMDMILFKSDGDRYFLHKQHKQQNICHFIRGKMIEFIQQNQIITLLMDIFALYAIYVCINKMTMFLAHSDRIIYDDNENILWLTIRYSLIVSRIICSLLNCLLFDGAQFMMAHCYLLFMYQFIVITWTIFLKLDQINSTLNTKRIMNKSHPRYYSRIVNRFLWLHGHNFDQVNRLTCYESDLFSSYLIANFPMNLLLIITTYFFDNNNQFYLWKFLLLIHKCSHKIIYYSVHFPLRPLSLHIHTSLYIEKIHTLNQYGIIFGRATLISMMSFLKFNAYV
ncbi:hypothetical protein HUG17_6443 [Dermatophagoides farinae]|uniref:Uncharacterized protein n=1 Tax=Dermatophagoides farinae TaxID=6954 RepID=A0A9D4P3J5_DERFA|nr:hypothetical protein HUG17_6443 [Dermatophagoides farinae]